MNIQNSRLAQLSPEQRAILEAKLLEKNRQHNEALIIPKQDRTQPCSLSFAQQRLWFLEQLEPGSPTYHITRTLKLRGPLNIDALQQSLTTIVERHESLRTYFVTHDGIPQQVVIPLSSFELPCIDLTHFDASQRPTLLKTQLTEAVQRPFDLTGDLLLRASLWRLGVEEHLLQIVMHHIASDGWSMGIFTRELGQLYQAYAHGQANPLAELPIQYADFAQWQRQWLTGNVLESQLSYWKQHLSGAPALLPLPSDHPRPPQPSYSGSRLTFLIPNSLTDALKQLGQQAGTTLFMTLLAAFNTLLYRYTQQEDMVVGSPIANRNRVELEGLIGFFANTLALRTDLSGSPSFQELLERVRQVTLDAYAHQDLPFEKLVEELQPERSLSYSPLFQVMFALQNAPGSALQLAELSFEHEPVDQTSAKFDLTLSMNEEATGLRGVFEYSTDLFERATIERMVGHFQTLLAGIVAHPEQSIATLPLLTPSERHQLLVEWNQTETDYPRDKCIHQLFEEQAERTPDAIAVVFEDQQLTYSELNHRANQLAHYLQSLGVGPEMLVGICLERSLEMMIGLLGILKAGGAYVPIDPTYPRERQAYILEDSQAPILITQRSLQSHFAQHNAQIVCLDADWQAPPMSNPSRNLVRVVRADHLAYIIYTSGSTGKPKGVQIEHRSVVNLLNSVRKQVDLTTDDVVLSVTTISFDIAASEIFLPLSVGARLVLVSREVAANGMHLLQVLTTCGATFMQPTPATWRLLMAAGWQDTPNLKMVSTGEPLPRELGNELLRRGKVLWNLYGPTETTIWSAGWQVAYGDGPIYIGYPVNNTQLYLLDTHLQPVPVGIPGELYIGGDGLARGYLNRPELTAEKFIDNPFDSGRLYKTGDLVRYLSNGNIEYLGRIDHQVKLRGFRIELGEVEAALNQHPDVQNVVVVDREDEPGDKRLVAYWVAANAMVPTSTELRQFLQQTLPDYMIPSAFVQLDVLPLTPNGKVDRRALPQPDASDIHSSAGYVAPRTPLEQQLADIWAEVLKLEKVGIHDNFFELGGHSLLAVKLFAQIEKVFKINLPLVTLFQSPTVEELAKVLRQQGWKSSWYSLVPIQPTGSRPTLFGIHFLVFQDLSRYLGQDQPVYGLRYGMAEPTNTVVSLPKMEDLAAHYIQQMRLLQPEGPYFLMGLCMGGVIAYEMAQQLDAQGQQVALLALCDSFLGSGSKLLSPLQILSNLLRQGPAGWLKLLNLWITHKLRLLRHGNQYHLAHIDNNDALLQMKKDYTPKPYSGRVTLFKATEKRPSIRYDSSNSPEVEWIKLVNGELEVHQIAGNHHTMLMEPGIQQLAATLQDCIDRALAETHIKH